LKKRTKIASIFPNEESLLRLVGAMLMETAEQWLGEKKVSPHGSFGLSEITERSLTNPHAHIEGLGSKVKSRHIWLEDGVQ